MDSMLIRRGGGIDIILLLLTTHQIMLKKVKILMIKEFYD